MSPDGPTGRVSQTLTGLPSTDCCVVMAAMASARRSFTSGADATEPSMSRSIAETE